MSAAAQPLQVDVLRSGRQVSPPARTLAQWASAALGRRLSCVKVLPLTL